MKKLKILNLYAGIGGNRKLWPEDIDVVAVELDPKIAKIYQDFFPNDKVIVADAHQYLLEHFEEFDFIWSSPPCPTHSVCNNFLFAQGNKRYPDMSLWQEIILLKKRCKTKWVVENVKPYYEPLYPATELDRHLFWSNFVIRPFQVERSFNIANARATTRKTPNEDMKALEEFHSIKLPDKITGKRLLLRNCVYPPLGLHIFQEAFREKPTLF